MSRFVPLLALAFGLIWQPALADALLRPNIVVDGEMVKLGDLFDGAGDKFDLSVARAPAPGRRIVVDADWLQRVANMNGLAWRPENVFEQAVIERSGVTITHEQIEPALVAALVGQGVGGSIQVVLANRGAQMIVPVNVTPQVGVRDLLYDNQYNHFTALVEVPADAPNATRIRVSGRVVRTVEIPVLAHPVSSGAVIGARDVTWVKMRQDAVRRDVITTLDQLIGLTPRQTLRSGEMVSTSEVQRPVAVARGALVTMVLRYGAMSLTAQGRAIEQGSVGDVIHVTNTHSNLSVEGRIDAPNVVSVSLGGTTTALAN